MIENFKGWDGQKWLWPVWDSTLKLTVFEEWANWFFACSYRFTKISSWSKSLLGGHYQKWVWPVWSWDSKIDCISKLNRWTDFLHAGTNSVSVSNWFSHFWQWVILCQIIRRSHGWHLRFYWNLNHMMPSWRKYYPEGFNSILHMV